MASAGILFAIDATTADTTRLGLVTIAGPINPRMAKVPQEIEPLVRC